MYTRTHLMSSRVYPIRLKCLVTGDYGDFSRMAHLSLFESKSEASAVLST